MALSVVQNMMASNASRQNGIQERKKTKAMEKLSSGYRLNRSADDAAGLQISEKMRSQIRGLNRASDNVQDGISYVQTADGALSEIHDMLHRIRELSIQSANDTNTPEDRYAIDKEIQQIKAEMGRIFADTEFNNKKIWSGEGKVRQVVTGIENVPAVTMALTSHESIITNSNKGAVGTAYFLKADDTGVVVEWKGYNGTKYESNVIPYGNVLAGTHSFKLSDHMDYTKYPEAKGIDLTYSYTVHENATLDDVVNSLNRKGINVETYPSEYVEKFPSSASDVWFSVDIEYPALLVSNKDFEAADDAFIEGTDTNLLNDPTDAGNSASKWEFSFDVENIGTVKATSVATSYYATTSEPDDGKWWYWATRTDGTKYKQVRERYAQNSDGTLDSVYNVMERTDGLSLKTDTQYGGTICVKFNLKADTPYTCPNGLTTNSVGTLKMYVSMGKGDTLDSIKEKLSKVTGIDIYDDATATTTKAINKVKNGGINIDVPSYRAVYESRKDLYIQSGANSWDSIMISYEDLTVDALGLGGKDVTTAQKANEMISAVDRAITIISDQRSTFGAYQNRLEYAKAVDDNSAENMQTAESRIRDADMSESMVEYSKGQILSQAGQSMIAQANKMHSQVLSLLQ